MTNPKAIESGYKPAARLAHAAGLPFLSVPDIRVIRAIVVPQGYRAPANDASFEPEPELA